MGIPGPIGATKETLCGFVDRTGLVVPEPLAEWLRDVNGARIGPGGVLGIRPDDPYCDIETILHGYPEWVPNGWIPVAGDGCGNYYVLGPDCGMHPICFINTSSDYLKPAYLVASGIWPFLRFLFDYEIGERRWPFSRAYVIAHDPGITSCSVARMPWDT